MAYKVFVREEAEAEAIEAYLYYDQIQPALGARFLATLQFAYAQLADTPLSYGILSADSKHVLRDVKIKGFPFVVIFEVINKEVHVYAVHNTYKNPLDFT